MASTKACSASVKPFFPTDAQDKSKFDSREHEGSRLVVVFYPAAFTGVCTEEMCTFTDLMADLEKSVPRWWEFR